MCLFSKFVFEGFGDLIKYTEIAGASAHVSEAVEIDVLGKMDDDQYFVSGSVVASSLTIAKQRIDLELKTIKLKGSM